MLAGLFSSMTHMAAVWFVLLSAVHMVMVWQHIDCHEWDICSNMRCLKPLGLTLPQETSWCGLSDSSIKFPLVFSQTLLLTPLLILLPFLIMRSSAHNCPPFDFPLAPGFSVGSCVALGLRAALRTSWQEAMPEKTAGFLFIL